MRLEALESRQNLTRNKFWNDLN